MLQVFVYLIPLILQGPVWCETNAKPIAFLVTNLGYVESTRKIITTRMKIEEG